MILGDVLRFKQRNPGAARAMAELHRQHSLASSSSCISHGIYRYVIHRLTCLPRLRPEIRVRREDEEQTNVAAAWQRAVRSNVSKGVGAFLESGELRA